MGQLLLVVIVLNVATAAAGHFQTVPAFTNSRLRSALPLSTVVGLHCITDLPVVASVFGLTYFLTVLLKLKGLLVSAGVLLWYPIFLKPLVKYYWPWIKLPNLLLTEFVRSADGNIVGLADHLASSIAVRAAVSLIFPFAALLVLRKRDVV